MSKEGRDSDASPEKARGRLGWICFALQQSVPHSQQQGMDKTSLPEDWVLFFQIPPLAQQLIPPPWCPPTRASQGRVGAFAFHGQCRGIQV